MLVALKLVLQGLSMPDACRHRARTGWPGVSALDELQSYCGSTTVAKADLAWHTLCLLLER